MLCQLSCKALPRSRANVLHHCNLVVPGGDGASTLQLGAEGDWCLECWSVQVVERWAEANPGVHFSRPAEGQPMGVGEGDSSGGGAATFKRKPKKSARRVGSDDDSGLAGAAAAAVEAGATAGAEGWGGATHAAVVAGGDGSARAPALEDGPARAVAGEEVKDGAEAGTAVAAGAVLDPPPPQACKFWLNQGACFKGDRCKYAHSADREGQIEWIAERKRQRRLLSLAEGDPHGRVLQPFRS